MTERSARRGMHTDWRTWVAILVMLSAIGMYLFTLDDSTADPDAGFRLRWRSRCGASGAQPALRA